jgi:aldehyde dehydrogenase (NAD+)
MGLQDAATGAAEHADVGKAFTLDAVPRLLIGGWLIEAGQALPSLNPATGEVLGQAPDATVDQAEAAVGAARRAFDTTDWSTNVELRIRCLDQLYRAWRRDHAGAPRPRTTPPAT